LLSDLREAHVEGGDGRILSANADPHRTINLTPIVKGCLLRYCVICRRFRRLMFLISSSLMISRHFLREMIDFPQ